MQIFVKSECDYVAGEMSVGMFATPLTLSAAALSWIPWLNFNRCSTMCIRQGDLAVLFHCAVELCMHYANDLGLFSARSARTLSAKLCVRDACIYLCISVSRVCVCVCLCVSAGGRATAFNSAACVFSLSRPKGTSSPEMGLKITDEGPVVNLEY